MTSIGRHSVRLITVAAVQVSASARPRRAIVPSPTTHQKIAAKPAIAAPDYIRDQIDALGSAFKGEVGIAVRSIDERWETGWKDHDLYPQQSVSKLWVSITAPGRGGSRPVSLDDRVTLTRADLTLFHQPIADEILKDGPTPRRSAICSSRAITTSDNTANDKLMRSVGGPRQFAR